jgi:pimeloyl-ACP methyl ester carboxylesterase
MPPDPPDWSHAYADANGVRLHYVEAGGAAAAAGRPLAILLHGFPEFWYGWRNQLGPLAAAGFRVVAPDMRGYNLSSKPPRVADYRVETLAGDVLALARHLGHARFHLVGHDWGGVVAWQVAMQSEPSVDRLVILNAPHPAAYLRELRRPRQLLRSWYVFAFQLPRLPEAAIRARDFAALRKLFRHEPARPGAFGDDDVERYVEAFRRPGALTAAVNYYRAAARRSPAGVLRSARPVDAPTLVVWGERDKYMVPEMAGGTERWARDVRVERLPAATHWVQHDEPARVNDLIASFLKS